MVGIQCPWPPEPPLLGYRGPLLARLSFAVWAGRVFLYGDILGSHPLVAAVAARGVSQGVVGCGGDVKAVRCSALAFHLSNLLSAHPLLEGCSWGAAQTDLPGSPADGGFQSYPAAELRLRAPSSRL